MELTGSSHTDVPKRQSTGARDWPRVNRGGRFISTDEKKKHTGVRRQRSSLRRRSSESTETEQRQDR